MAYMGKEAGGEAFKFGGVKCSQWTSGLHNASIIN